MQIRHSRLTSALIVFGFFLLAVAIAPAYNNLPIPDTIAGKNFNLSIRDTFMQYRSGNQTITSAVNGMTFWGPTLIFQQGDTVHLSVKNQLNDSTTIHWHGIHLPAVMDGGPHQIIPPGTVWQPYWKVTNKASTYWYHPHLHQMTQEHLTKGIGGFIIIRDAEEAALALPRSYGVDDIPLVFTSRRFDGSNQFVTSNSAYGDYELTNGVMDAQVTLPKQMVRLRLLNGEIERAYIFGFSDNRKFYVIGNDGGLLNAPVEVTRIKMAVGERYEILVDLSNDAVGSSVDLKAYNSAQAFGFPGGEPATSGQFGSLLNNKDFVALHINIGSATASAITSVPTTLASNTYWKAADATVQKSVKVTDGTPGTAFTLDSKAYGFNRIDKITQLNDVEQWTVTNNQIFTHAFHIHDIQFKIVARNGSASAVGAYESGWKDVAYLPINENLSFVAKFDDYADSTHPFMYHCHFVDHEDGGMMGQFVVVAPQNILSVSPQSINIAAPANSSKTFNVSSNLDWTLSCDSTWLSFSKQSGNGNAVVTATATQNSSLSPRSTVVNVSAAGMPTQKVNVTQDGEGPFVILSTSNVDLAPNGSAKSLNLSSNTHWTLSAADSWCTVNPDSGTGNAVLNISATNNSANANRNTTITVKANSLSDQKITVTQSFINDVATADDIKAFSIYPNPASNRLFIQLGENIQDAYYLSIYAYNGRCVMMLPRPELAKGIDISELTNGSYFLRLTDGKSMKDYYQRFQKQ